MPRQALKWRQGAPARTQKRGNGYLRGKSRTAPGPKRGSAWGGRGTRLWINDLLSRRAYNVVVAAVANKLARILGPCPAVARPKSPARTRSGSSFTTCPNSSGCWSAPASSWSSTGSRSPTGAAAPLPDAHPRTHEAVEAEPDGPAVPRALGGLHQGEGGDARAHQHPEAPWSLSRATTRRRRASTPSPICWRRCPTRRCRTSRSTCPTRFNPDYERKVLPDELYRAARRTDRFLVQ